MSRLTTPASDDITDDTQRVLGNVGKQFGFVPNMFTMLASNPTVLDVVLSLQGSLGSSSRRQDPAQHCAGGVGSQRLRLLPGGALVRLRRARRHVGRRHRPGAIR